MKNKKLIVVVCVLWAFILLAGTISTALTAETEAQKQLNQNVAKQLSDKGIKLLTGTIWQKASQDEKVAFVWGFCHVVTIEEALMQQYPQLKVENFSAKVVEGMTGVKMNDIVRTVDEYYAANPGELEVPVMRVMWETLIKPNLKSGIAGQPLQK
jgi:hypothetical protein